MKIPREVKIKRPNGFGPGVIVTEYKKWLEKIKKQKKTVKKTKNKKKK